MSEAKTMQNAFKDTLNRSSSVAIYTFKSQSMQFDPNTKHRTLVGNWNLWLIVDLDATCLNLTALNARLRDRVKRSREFRSIS